MNFAYLYGGLSTPRKSPLEPRLDHHQNTNTPTSLPLWLITAVCPFLVPIDLSLRLESSWRDLKWIVTRKRACDFLVLGSVRPNPGLFSLPSSPSPGTHPPLKNSPFPAKYYTAPSQSFIPAIMALQTTLLPWNRVTLMLLLRDQIWPYIAFPRAIMSLKLFLKR